jgi:hypothetical protein
MTSWRRLAVSIPVQADPGIGEEPLYEQCALTRIAAGFGPFRAASTAVVIENEQTDHGREIGVEAFAVDGLKEATYRRPLSSRYALERIPEGVLEGHAGSMPADTDASFHNQGFPARSVCGCCAHVIPGSPIVGGYPGGLLPETIFKIQVKGWPEPSSGKRCSV